MTLRAIALDDPSITVAGALDVQRTSDRIRVRRLPAWTQAQSPEAAFELMVAMGSGVRLCFTTDADTIELDALATGLQFVGEPRRPSVFDLCADGVCVSRKMPPEGPTFLIDRDKSVRFEAGSACTVQFSGLGSALKSIAVFLPHAAMTDIRGLRLSSSAQLEANPSPRFRWAHYGSSISHGMEAAGPSETWPALASQRAGVDLTNLGFAGQCHVDGFVARTLRDGPFDLLSLKIGANVVASDSLRLRTFASSVHSFLDTVRDRKPATPVLLMSPIFSPLIDDLPGPVRRIGGGGYARVERVGTGEDGALSLAAIRGVLKDLVARRRAGGDPHLHYLDGTALMSADDVSLMPDQLHPCPEGHRVMARRFYAAAFAGEGPFSAFSQGPKGLS